MSNINQRLNSQNPLAYVGVNATQPPEFMTAKRDPNAADNNKFFVGTIWFNTSTSALWILTGSAPNVISWVSLGTGGLRSATVTLTSSQIKNLNATPITIIPAQGVGTFINVISWAIKFTYGGSNVFVAGAGQTIQLSFNTTPLITSTFVTNGIIVSSQTQYTTTVQPSTITQVPASVENIPVMAYNPVATEISGNAAGDNTITVVVNYQVLTI